MRLRIFALAMWSALAFGQALEQAKRAFDRGDYAAAARLFEEAQKASPRCDTLFFLGLTRYRMQQPEAALIAFRSAVECDPKLLPAHLAMAEAYSERHNDAEALSAYNRALQLEPKNAAALSGAANLYLKGQANEQAVALLKVLAEVEPQNAEARAALGAAYAASGNRELAAAEYRVALKLRPGNASALMGLGNLSLKNGDEEQAIGYLRQAAQAAPKAFEPHFLLGSAYNRLNRYQEALEELQAAQRLGGNESELYYHLARAYGGLGRPQDRAAALARFAQLTSRSKDDAEAQRRARDLMEEAKKLVDAGNLHLATARMEEAREIRPADDRLLFRLASLYYDLKRFDLAQSYTQEALALAPTEWVYHYLAGLIAKGAGRWTQARQSLETAARLNAKAAEVQNALGETAQHEGDRERAIAAFQRAVELDPNERAYRLNLEAARAK